MKCALRCILGAAAMSWSTLSAIDAESNFSDFSTVDIKETEKERPFFVKLSGDAIAKSEINRTEFKGDKFRYSEVEGSLNLVFLYNPPNKEGLYGSLGFDVVRLDWPGNPYFRQERFDTANIALGAFTERFKGWIWHSFVSMNMDTGHFDPSEYATYDLMLWGRYAYCANLGVHIGFLAQTGMKVDQVYPVLGVDWDISNNWKLNLVFPVNVSAIYLYDKVWSFELAGRAFNSVHRTDKHAPLSKAIFTYRAYAGEFGINYDYNSWIIANIHAGYTMGGTLKIANRHYKHRKRLDFDSAPYFGGEFEIKF